MRSTREREGKIVQVDIDYESRQPIHTPAYHTSEQSTLQTPHSLCLDPHTTLANTYDDFRVTTYNLRLMTSQLCFAGTYYHQQPPAVSQFNLSQQPANSYDLRLTTYDFPALLYWDPLGPTTTNNHQQPPANNYGDFRVTTYDLRLPSF